MRTTKSSSVTQLLFDWSHGDEQALDELMPLVYPELRKLAGRYLRKERSDHILQPTALIHEAYVRLMDQDLPQWQGRTHFYGIASRLMRQILVDYAARAPRRDAAVPIANFLSTKHPPHLSWKIRKD